MEDIAEFRRAVRAHLAERPAVAQPAATIHRALKREWGCELEEVAQACVFLLSLGHFKEVRDPLGGRVVDYQITAAGTIAHESES